MGTWSILIRTDGKIRLRNMIELRYPCVETSSALYYYEIMLKV